MDGPIDLHDILRVRGEKELQRYLVDEIQEVYRLPGVNINDKHIDVISRQMMRWVKVEEGEDSEFPHLDREGLPGRPADGRGVPVE